jgi:hypothetical protein
VKPLLLQFGKDGNAYLLDRTNLGGIGGALLVKRVANSAIRTVPTAYAMNGTVFVAFQAPAALCLDGDTAELAALAIVFTPRLSLRPAWCAPLDGVQPVPIVTTTNGSADPIVWIVGAAGDNRLHGFRGDTGQPVYNGGTASDRMRGLHHFEPILVAEDTFYIPGNGRVYVFRFGSDDLHGGSPR